MSQRAEYLTAQASVFSHVSEWGKRSECVDNDLDKG
jgi:hypothetical protein